MVKQVLVLVEFCEFAYFCQILKMAQQLLLSQPDSEEHKSESSNSVKFIEKSDLSHVCRPLFDLGLILPNVTRICNYFYGFGLENFPQKKVALVQMVGNVCHTWWTFYRWMR